MNNNLNVYGWVNGNPVYSRDEFIFTSRKFGEITSNEELLKYAEKVTSNWYSAGWHQTFETYYLGTYCLDHPMCDLTTKEYNRLKELQQIARNKKQAEEDAKEWKYDHTIYWADNSEEEVWVNKFGETKTVMVVAPHGDAC